MSLSNALTNAVSGLMATARGTEVVAANLANATTPGYARRELQLADRPLVSGGGGIHVDEAVRVVRISVLAQGRLAAAETARAQVLADFHASLSDAIGVPGEAGALTTLLSGLDSTLVTAAARPESEAGLSQVAVAARDLARGFNALGAQVQDARGAADRAIASDVAALNEGLERIAALNRQITTRETSGTDSNAQQDERQRIIDALSEIIPVKELPREAGRVALFTAKGGVLLDGFSPARFDFTPAGVVTPETTGTLGLLSLNGEAIQPEQMGRFAGGRLAANFQIRDLDGPLAQARLDAAAADLYDRFADPAVDPTLAAGAAGLFTDAGAQASGAPGLAQRLSLNPAVDPAAGGAPWRLRDGLGAAAAGPSGSSDLLLRMQEALGTVRASPSALGVTPGNAATFAAELTSLAATGRLRAERELSAATAQSSGYDAMMQQDGVDSDREMEALLTLERAYASNARVLQAVDEMIQTILRLT